MSGTMKVELVDHMGSDLSVVNAARVSFDKESTWDVIDGKPDIWRVGDKVRYTRSIDWGPGAGSVGEIVVIRNEDIGTPAKDYQVFWVKQGGGIYWTTPDDVVLADSVLGKQLRENDAKLIRYLAKHDHWTPFAHTAISLRVSAPVPIRTQCFKHKQGLVENEESRRYIKSRPELYVPDYFRKAPVDGAKQGSLDERHELSGYCVDTYIDVCTVAIDLYMEMLEDGICPEQARFVLPQGCMVNWIWTGNLYAFANFYLKRTDPHAQKEVQQVAKLVGQIIEPLFPVSWKALTNV